MVQLTITEAALQAYDLTRKFGKFTANDYAIVLCEQCDLPHFADAKMVADDFTP